MSTTQTIETAAIPTAVAGKSYHGPRFSIEHLSVAKERLLGCLWAH